MNKEFSKIINNIKNKNKIIRLTFFILGTLLLAINYNLILLPNNLVIGGTSGLSIVLAPIINPQLFIFISSVILIIISYILLGTDKTLKSLVGTFLFPIFTIITLPLCDKLLPYFTFDNYFLLIFLAGFLSGISYGIIFKMGYTTGGSDIMVQIVNEYFKISSGKASRFINTIIILTGGFTFGFTKLIYSVIILYINTEIIDRIMIGISDSKMFYIHTKQEEKLKDFIINELKYGVTILDSEGGYSKEKKSILLCVVKTSDYYLFKETILSIDKDAFLIVTDCYEVTGGVKRNKLAFLND